MTGSAEEYSLWSRRNPPVSKSYVRIAPGWLVQYAPLSSVARRHCPSSNRPAASKACSVAVAPPNACGITANQANTLREDFQKGIGLSVRERG
jgi:hypothetical protein